MQNEQYPATGSQPQRPLWRLALIVAVIAFCLWIMWSFRQHVLFFFEPSEPKDLGVAEFLQKESLPYPGGSYVCIEGFPEAHRVIKWEERFGEDRKIFRLVGAQPRIFVQVPATIIKNGVFPDNYCGRLLPMADLPASYETVRRFYAEQFNYDIPEGSYIIFVNERPEDKWVFILLYGIMICFIIFDLFIFFRMLLAKPLADDDDGAHGDP